MDDQNEYNERDEEKLDELDERLHAVMLRYTFNKSFDSKSFPEDFDKMIKSLMRCLTHVFVSGAFTQKMDREKFIVTLDKLTTEMKKKAQDDFEYLKSKRRDEGSE